MAGHTPLTTAIGFLSLLMGLFLYAEGLDDREHYGRVLGPVAITIGMAFFSL